jgi:hypothetical protein
MWTDSLQQEELRVTIFRRSVSGMNRARAVALPPRRGRHRRDSVLVPSGRRTRYIGTAGRRALHVDDRRGRALDHDEGEFAHVA